MSYQVLARKWRPRTFQAMVGQEHVLRMLTNALDQNRLHHAYLFTGTRGVGKTTLGRLLAKCLNCQAGITSNPCNSCNHCTAIDSGHFLDLLEIDAASRTKVEDTRELLENVQYQPVQGRFKVYLIDEVHMLSGHSFNALLKTLEEPPSYVKFLLATTDPKRLPITILSRCLQFSLKRVPVIQIQQHLQHICTTENIAFETPALTLLAEAADGSLRDALSLLDQTIAFCGEHIALHETQQMLGNIEPDALFRLLHALANKNGQELLTTINQLAEHALDFNQALEQLLSILHQISIAQVIRDSSQHEKISQLASLFSAEDIQLYYQIALIGRRDIALAVNSQQGFEMIMLRMLAFRPASLETALPIRKDMPSTQKSPEKTSPQKNIVNPSSNEITLESWSAILEKLNLSGMAHALASNCTIKNITVDKITLAVSNQHQAMCNKKLIERIEQALRQLLNKPIILDIQLTKEDVATPAKQRQEQQILQQKNAIDAIKNDQQVKEIINVFNATLNEDSIQAI
ncbi:MAG: DNA polymerase III subunit gamma/tau [Gammaproteobacteria bacterium]|nr:DNA polymerase III subunit gamma/tau [Gammaproteobacteria bacterium]